MPEAPYVGCTTSNIIPEQRRNENYRGLKKKCDNIVKIYEMQTRQHQKCYFHTWEITKAGSTQKACKLLFDTSLKWASGKILLVETTVSQTIRFGLHEAEHSVPIIVTLRTVAHTAKQMWCRARTAAEVVGRNGRSRAPPRGQNCLWLTDW